MQAIDPLGAGWRKSSWCAHGECIEVGTAEKNRVAVRDSARGTSGPSLVFTPEQWRSFVGGIKPGRAGKR